MLALERSDQGFSGDSRGGHARRERLPQAGLRGSHRRWVARHSLSGRTQGWPARHVATPIPPRQLVGNRKDDMDVVHRQQFPAASGEPLIASVGLALGAVPGAAGVERDGLMATLAAAIQMTAQGSRAAVLDGEKYAEMEPGQPGPALLDETVAMRADDIGHLERWRLHLLDNLRDRFTWSRLVSLAWSSGVPAARRCRSDRCR